MKNRAVVLTCIAVLLASLTALAEDKKVIAVGDPNTHWAQTEACKGYAPTYATSLADSLRSRIAESGVYRVVTRVQMGKLLKEHEMAMTGITDPNRVKSLGKLLQADFLLGVELICHPNTVEINVNLWDTETGESVFAKVYEQSDLESVRKALVTITKAIAEYGKTGRASASDDCFTVVDSKAFHDAANFMVERIHSTIPRASGAIEELNMYDGSMKVKINSSGFEPWAGLKFKVKRGDEELGWVFLKKKGRGVIDAGVLNNDDMSKFEQGDQVSSEEFEPVVAMAQLEDVDEAVENLGDCFRKRINEILGQSEGIKPVEDDNKAAQKVLMRIGKEVNKKDLESLHKAGVDLMIVGRFLGKAKSRRVELEVISTFDGKKVIDIKRDRIGL